MLSDEERREAAAALAHAEAERRPIRPLAESYPAMDVVDSYEIALLNIRERVEHGAPVLGHKVGLSSEAMQQMMGVDEPDYGHLLADMALAEDTPVDLSRYCYPRVEVEVAFILGASLPGEGCTEEDVLEATEYVAPAIELIDSRIVDWQIGLVDTIADNASSAGFVLGTERVKPRDIDLL
ncbi:MAG TPA: 2-keto-4-pentenoate hydratase, partial [Nocardioidaceae bacterium]|nr:2-keto-4-pentenoate hydratase [Nocardioidaceae bacterium]